jgi:hypothetical protein
LSIRSAITPLALQQVFTLAAALASAEISASRIPCWMRSFCTWLTSPSPLCTAVKPTVASSTIYCG